MRVSARIRLQVTAFVVIALLGVSYLAVRYAGLGRLVGSDGYTVQLQLADSGGIFSNAEVTYRGVPVGRVGELRLTATGISADLHITSHRKIPASLTAVVADRSAIGEQYVDLRPGSADGPYLRDGSVIPQSDTALPPPVDQLLDNVNRLAASVPARPLNTLVDQLSQAVAGSSTDLQTLIGSADQLVQRASADFPQQSQLIDATRTVLATQQQEAGSITSFSSNLALLAHQLRSSDPDLRRLIATAPVAANQVSGLVSDIGDSAGMLIGNLLTVSDLTLANLGGVRELLVTYPQAVSVGSSVITAKGIDVGLSLTFFDPLPCTSGYRGTVRRPASDVSAGQPLNTSAGCTQPAAGSEVRGSAAAASLGRTAAQSWPGTLLGGGQAGDAPSTLRGLLGLGD
ncbi:MAG TPA: MCE family protein [Jatrophihabitans sp.]|nr:MCE family protein [Jatrophihabitans sp.]